MNKFVILYNDFTIRAVPESIVSKMYDLADCDYMDNVRQIYAADENGKLVPIEVGPQKRDPDWTADSATVYYASSKIMAGKRTVGFVHYSDH